MGAWTPPGGWGGVTSLLFRGEGAAAAEGAPRGPRPLQPAPSAPGGSPAPAPRGAPGIHGRGRCGSARRRHGNSGLGGGATWLAGWRTGGWRGVGWARSARAEAVGARSAGGRRGPRAAGARPSPRRRPPAARPPGARARVRARVPDPPPR